MKKRDKYYNQQSKLTPKNPVYQKQMERFLLAPIADDIGSNGDITTTLFTKKTDRSTAIIKAKQAGIIAGLREVVWLLKRYNIRVAQHVHDGAKIKKGAKLLSLSGNTRMLLLLERTVLNALQRMSGIATQTHMLTSKIRGKALLCATRKTQWGLLDKRAVTLGGGGTHRLGLHDFVLIKDTHLTLPSADIEKAIAQIKNKKLFWEIEVSSLKQTQWAAAYHPDVIMLDNMTPAQIKHVLAELKPANPKILFEASGGISAKNIASYAKTGVDIISMGALTHSVTALDIHMTRV